MQAAGGSSIPPAFKVAPHAGAWIETKNNKKKVKKMMTYDDAINKVGVRGACLVTVKPCGHYYYLMQMGRLMPTTRGQARAVLRAGACPDVLGAEDIERIETQMRAHGRQGYYQLTSSKSWARLINVSEWHDTLKEEWGL